MTIGLFLLGVPFALILSIIAEMTELEPVVGPWVGAIAGVPVTLATESHLMLWVILLFLGVQMLENTLLVPRIQRDSLNLYPVAIVLTIVVASSFFGLWRVIIGPPLVSLFWEMFVWFMREWNRPAKAEGGDDAGAEAERPEPEDG